jgi:hypothetical protein
VIHLERSALGLRDRRIGSPIAGMVRGTCAPNCLVQASDLFPPWLADYTRRVKELGVENVLQFPVIQDERICGIGG